MTATTAESLILEALERNFAIKVRAEAVSVFGRGSRVTNVCELIRCPAASTWPQPLGSGHGRVPLSAVSVTNMYYMLV